MDKKVKEQLTALYLKLYLVDLINKVINKIPKIN
jgi:hypothetical protein